MNSLLEKLQAEIEANTEVSFTVSEVEPVLSAQAEPAHAAPSGDGGSPKPQQYTRTALTDDTVATMEGWLDEDYLHTISDKIVIAQLDDILLLLIAVRDGACGKVLLEDVRRLFGTDLSPGTVYPHLTSLADEGVLDVTELAKRKVYQHADLEATLNTVEPTVDRLTTFSLVLKAIAIDCIARHSEARSETDE